MPKEKLKSTCAHCGQILIDEENDTHFQPSTPCENKAAEAELKRNKTLENL